MNNSPGKIGLSLLGFLSSLDARESRISILRGLHVFLREMNFVFLLNSNVSVYNFIIVDETNVIPFGFSRQKRCMVRLDQFIA